jgi:hypothetical protein
MESTLIPVEQNDIAVIDGSLNSAQVAAALSLPLARNPFAVKHPLFVISTGAEARALIGLRGKVDGAGVIAWQLDEVSAMELLDQGFPLCFGEPTREKVVALLGTGEVARRQMAEDKELCGRLINVERSFGFAAAPTQR